MKKSFIIIALFLTSIVQCQITSNIITEIEYNNIEINGIKLKDFKATEGNETKIKNLISNPILEKDINTGERGPSNYWFKYNGFEIAFTNHSGITDHPGIAMFNITNNNWNIKIKGTTITIGDNINKLGSIIFNTKTNGGKGIIYQYCNGCNNYIYIDFNQTSKKITKIGFIEQT